jgi:hypothetical protein
MQISFKMSEHLKRFQGLFHVSELQPDPKVMKTDSDDIRAKLSNKQSTITGL